MRAILLLLCCLMCTAVCAQLPGIQFHSYAEKYRFLKTLETTLNARSDKQALDSLSELGRVAIEAGDKELAGEIKLLGIERSTRNQKNIEAGSENTLKELAAAAASDKLYYLQADALQRLGNYYSADIHEQSAAIESYMQAYEVYKKFTGFEFPPKLDYLYILGGACYHLEDFDNAVEYLREACMTRDSGRQDPYCSLYNTIGLCYRGMKQYDSAISYFKKTYEHAVINGNKPYKGIAEGNIGIAYFLQGKYEEAVPLLKKDIDNSILTIQIKNAASSMTTLATIYNSQRKYKKARQLLMQALSLCRSRPFWPNYRMAEGLYKQLYRAYSGERNMQQAFLYADSTLRASDTVNALNNALALTKAHDKIKYTQHKLEQEKLQQQITNAQFEINKNRIEIISNRKINLALGLSTVLFLALGIIVYFKNKQIATEKEKSDAQRQRAENSERFKQQFLANMSHEIRTPMNAVIGMTDLILEKNPRPDQIGFLKAISKSSDILLHIINDILDLSKIEAGKMELEAIDFSLADMVRQVINTLSYRAEEKGLQITSRIDDDVPDIVVGDPYRINQVLVNLGGNAIKFTQRGGVEIIIRKIGEEAGRVTIQCEVADTGAGIPEDKLKTLFSAFTQANASDTRKYGGTGLGLSISKQLVELQGGKIAVDSKVGLGTTFSFNLTFPIGSQQKLQERIARETQVDGSILDGLRILAADDNEYNRMVVKETLHLKANVHTDIVENGAEVLKLLEQNNYDVILMDVQMPVMNGIEATRQIREKMPAPKNQIPIIAFTASILRADIEMFLGAGMNSYLPKPFKAWQLFHTIAEVTGRRPSGITPGAAQKPALGALHPAINNAGAVTDHTYLLKFCEGDEGRIRKYIHMYIDAVPDFKHTLTDAVTIKDFGAIGRRIHAFKPNWMMMGMHKAAELGNKVEQLCEGHNDNVYSTIQLLLDHTDKSIEELTDLLQHSIGVAQKN